MFKNLFRFQIKPDDIKAKLDDRKARKNEEYLQYLADNNLQNTYAPTKGKIFLLKCVVVISMMNLFFLKIRICVQKFSHFQHFRGTFLYNFFWFHYLFLIIKPAFLKHNICKNYANYKTLNTMLSFFLVNKDLRTISQNLLNYVNFESWKYCQKCHLVEPNNMLPNYGNQKLTYIKNCICEKGRYFVPTVCIFLIFYFEVCFHKIR